MVAVLILIGVLIGAVGYHFLFNHELLSIDTKIDLGSLVALLALAISVSVTPFIIDRKLNNQRSYEAMVCGEIEEIIKLLEAVDSLYSETYTKDNINEENVKQLRRLILYQTSRALYCSILKKISNCRSVKVYIQL